MSSTPWHDPAAPDPVSAWHGVHARVAHLLDALGVQRHFLADAVFVEAGHRVVRPRRPQAEAITPRPPAVPDPAARPTPLVLVSAQRIDQPVVEIQPRLVDRALAQRQHARPGDS